ncbi:cytochrome b [Herbaspirillum robiniae]|uniref:Cytochrome B n=1 Tax=Herbaspirillum robiniae TaxID=2014887 RepID=A0A246WLX8_9BURK|nr:cytochrome b [Herbaspirillum robiniae]NUU03034.1 cytochrome b [Herbaspirillum robiniae]OWY27345.1 cytochrome B [Herbaspirillum robiniae]
MQTSLSPHRYNAAARWLHWIIALLIVAAYTLILSRGEFARGSPERTLVVQSHYWAGIAVLLLAIPRVFNRRAHGAPAITPPLSSVMQKLAWITHLLLYLFLFAQPLLGMLTVWLGRGAIPVPLTELQVASPFALDKELSRSIKEVHETLGELFYYVIGLHVLAALFHHFLRRDDTLRRML